MTPALKSIMAKATKKTPTLIQDVEQAGILRKIPVDSPQLLYQFGGGITVGRMHRFRGPESSGKSSICNYISGQLQKHMPGYEFPDGLKIDEKQKIVVYVDFERSFDMKHATENGLDCSEGNFIYLTPDTIEDATDILVEMIPTGEICAVIFDSDASAPTRTQMADEAGKASFGAGAKALGEMLRKLNILCANYRTTLLYISQERAAMCFTKNALLKWKPLLKESY